jgi:hypothetical protein
MTTQILYETNIDSEATYQKLYEQRNSSEIPYSVSETGKGLLRIQFKKSSTIFLISPGGKMQVTWRRVDEKRILLKLLRSLLVPLEGQRLMIRPINQQPMIPYPAPENFKLYWCDEKTEYMKYDSLQLLLEQELLRYYAEAPRQ